MYKIVAVKEGKETENIEYSSTHYAMLTVQGFVDQGYTVTVHYTSEG